MGLRNALRSLVGQDAAEEQDIDSIPAEDVEAEVFRPRTDGTYTAAASDGTPNYLRFYFTGKVYFTVGVPSAAEARDLLGPQNSDPVVGQYTPAGRFSMQQRFERPVICAVQRLTEKGFVARITSAGAATSGEYDYTFEPDGI